MGCCISNRAQVGVDPPFQQIVPFDLGPPINATVAAGECVFDAIWKPTPLLAKINISVDTGACVCVYVNMPKHYFGETCPSIARSPRVHNAYIDLFNIANKTAVVLTFGLEENSPLGLSTCACLVARGGKDADGQPVIRAYTPISTNKVSVRL